MAAKNTKVFKHPTLTHKLALILFDLYRKNSTSPFLPLFFIVMNKLDLINESPATTL
jgi:hypothetical protein